MIANSAAMCRQQEALHRQTAAETPFANVRKIALRAAAAWQLQAIEAAQMEAGESPALSAEDAAIALEFRLDDDVEEDAVEVGLAEENRASRVMAARLTPNVEAGTLS
jgi:hypothetical protein